MKRGDYVLGTKYHDGDPGDHWAVGFYDQAFDHFGSQRHLIVDASGNPFRANGFRRVKKISAKRGSWMLKNAKWIELSGKSIWYFYRYPLNKLL